MLDKEKAAWRNHLHMRMALLEEQLMKTRDQKNYLEKVDKLSSDESQRKYQELTVRFFIRSHLTI